MNLDPPEDLNLADWLVEARVREAAASVWRCACRTRADLPRRAAAGAPVRQRPAGLGLRPEERVLLALRDGAEFVGALFGALAPALRS